MMNRLFNEDVTYHQMFLLADKVKTVLESEKQLENDPVLALMKKRKLQSVYRIRNNAFSLLLRDGFKVEKRDKNGETFIIMNIDGEEYDCKESVLKTLLQKDYDPVIEKCLTADKECVMEKEEITDKSDFEDEKETATEKEIDLKPVEKDEPLEEPVQAEEDMKEVKLEDNNETDISEKVDMSTPVVDNPILEDSAIPTEEISRVDSEMKSEVEIEEKAEESIIHDEIIEINDTEENQSEPADKETLDDIKEEEKPEPEITEDGLTEEDKVETFVESEDVSAQDVSNESAQEPEETPVVNEDNNSTDIKTESEINDEENVKEEEASEVAEKKDEAVKEEVKDPVSEKNDSEEKSIYHFVEEGKEPAVVLNDPTETDSEKSADDFIMDIYKIKVRDIKDNTLTAVTTDAGDEKTKEITLNIVPLSVPEDGSSFSHDIAVYLKCDTGEGTFASKLSGRKTVMVGTKEHSFLVTGTWEGGKFTTKVRPTNKTLVQQAEVSREVFRVRPVSESGAAVGHPVLFIEAEENGEISKLKVHCIPKGETNGKDGLAPAVYCLDNEKTDERLLYKTKDKNHIIFEFEGNYYKVKSKWEGNKFISEIDKLDLNI